MRAIKIDSKNRTVSEIDIDEQKGVLNEWYKAIGCELVEVAHYMSDKNHILVDEEGLLKDITDFFIYNGNLQPFAGNGLVVGVDEEGKTISCDVTLEEVTKNVTFVNEDEINPYLNTYLNNEK